tara:strand:+ start:993 stop:1169 length:177 start_codon:yes stop_codon:yes gene_type:complete
MKTIKKGNKIVRVSDKEAKTRTKSGWTYCPKSEWKLKVRDAKPKKATKKVAKNKKNKK